MPGSVVITQGARFSHVGNLALKPAPQKTTSNFITDGKPGGTAANELPSILEAPPEGLPNSVAKNITTGTPGGAAANSNPLADAAPKFTSSAMANITNGAVNEAPANANLTAESPSVWNKAKSWFSWGANKVESAVTGNTGQVATEAGEITAQQAGSSTAVTVAKGVLGRAGTVVQLGVGGYNVQRDLRTGDHAAVASDLGNTGGAFGGAALGLALGAAAGIETGPGAIFTSTAGGIIGSFVGEQGMRQAYDWFMSSTPATIPQAPTAAQLISRQMAVRNLVPPPFEMVTTNSAIIVAPPAHPHTPTPTLLSSGPLATPHFTLTPQDELQANVPLPTTPVQFASQKFIMTPLDDLRANVPAHIVTQGFAPTLPAKDPAPTVHIIPQNFSLGLPAADPLPPLPSGPLATPHFTLTSQDELQANVPLPKMPVHLETQKFDLTSQNILQASVPLSAAPAQLAEVPYSPESSVHLTPPAIQIPKVAYSPEASVRPAEPSRIHVPEVSYSPEASVRPAEPSRIHVPEVTYLPEASVRPAEPSRIHVPEVTYLPEASVRPAEPSRIHLTEVSYSPEASVRPAEPSRIHVPEVTYLPEASVRPAEPSRIHVPEVTYLPEASARPTEPSRIHVPEIGYSPEASVRPAEPSRIHLTEVSYSPEASIPPPSIIQAVSPSATAAPIAAPDTVAANLADWPGVEAGLPSPEAAIAPTPPTVAALAPVTTIAATPIAPTPSQFASATPPNTRSLAAQPVAPPPAIIQPPPTMAQKISAELRAQQIKNLQPPPFEMVTTNSATIVASPTHPHTLTPRSAHLPQAAAPPVGHLPTSVELPKDAAPPIGALPPRIDTLSYAPMLPATNPLPHLDLPAHPHTPTPRFVHLPQGAVAPIGVLPPAMPVNAASPIVSLPPAAVPAAIPKGGATGTINLSGDKAGSSTPDSAASPNTDEKPRISPSAPGRRSQAPLNSYFGVDSARLTADAKKIDLTDAAMMKEILEKDPTAKFVITGHTSDTGSTAHNQKLSLERAKAVRDDLIKDGIPASALEVTAAGTRDQEVKTKHGVEEVRNRRVTIEIKQPSAAATATTMSTNGSIASLKTINPLQTADAFKTGPAAAPASLDGLAYSP